MRCALSVLTALGSTVVLAAGAVAARPQAHVVVPSAKTAAAGAAAPAAKEAAKDQELQRLLDKLSAVSDLITRNAQSPEVWRNHLEQAEVSMELAAHCKGEERDNWLRMAVDSHYSAAVQSPDKERNAYQQLVDLPGRMAKAFPESPAIAYAALQGVKAEHARAVRKDSEHPDAAHRRLCEHLIRFSAEYALSPEASKAVLEAAELSEQQSKKEDAGRCYLYVLEHFPGSAAANKAEGGLWRMGSFHEPMRLGLPLLFAPNGDNPPFEASDLQGQTVLVYFWASDCPQAEQDFETLKQLTDRYQDRGLEVVYVNLDPDPAQAKAFLAGRLTSGVHLYQSGAIDGGIAERCGIQGLPHAILLGKDGMLIKHSPLLSHLQAEIADRLAHAR